MNLTGWVPIVYKLFGRRNQSQKPNFTKFVFSGVGYVSEVRSNVVCNILKFWAGHPGDMFIHLSVIFDEFIFHYMWSSRRVSVHFLCSVWLFYLFSFWLENIIFADSGLRPHIQSLKGYFYRLAWACFLVSSLSVGRQKRLVKHILRVWSVYVFFDIYNAITTWAADTRDGTILIREITRPTNPKVRAILVDSTTFRVKILRHRHTLIQGYIQIGPRVTINTGEMEVAQGTILVNTPGRIIGNPTEICLNNDRFEERGKFYLYIKFYFVYVLLFPCYITI